MIPHDFKRLGDDDYLLTRYVNDDSIYNHLFFDVRDNAFLDDGYVQQLEAMSPLERKVYLEGDFTVSVSNEDSFSDFNFHDYSRGF